MKMYIYVSDKYYEHMLDNTLMHIYNQSCGFTMSVCMACKRMILPNSMGTLMNGEMRARALSIGDKYSYESFFFVMCANCRTDVQMKLGGIPSRSKQRSMIETIIAERNECTSTHSDMMTNPSTYANMYVLSVENGVEIILLFGKKVM